MNKLFKKLDKKNTKELRKELARAHSIIVLLSVGIITLLAVGVTQSSLFDACLSAICISLLCVVTIVSLSLAIILFRKK